MTKSEQQMVEKLRDVVDDLDGFEADFVESMLVRPSTYPLSEKQAEKLEQIFNKHVMGEDDRPEYEDYLGD
jgi:hypothetical protein